ncbi:dipicolinic acid synthetase subunit A [Alteribacter natronophilus]|uniref:dipicolinic acid synthetase subunit A n=1 Tax=Alteribacter natronophilus TaxID=2583810 RepID=UPI00110D817E|nr:dipicolinic acid synthetase subunit A [Alteribacter natronophilus]TMW73258.1 dipicolinic acid synthetase subunit A [Alteribacter natronophilus]
MLTDMHVVIIGGDARQLEIIRKLSQLDANVSLVGFDQLDDGFAGAKKQSIQAIDPLTVDAVVLPVSGMNAKGEIESIFSADPVKLTSEWLGRTKKTATLYSGISTQTLRSLLEKSNRPFVEVFSRDDVAIYNSIPTAEGTIMMVIQHTDITIHSSEIMILGFGRVGMTAARTFSLLGAKVKVAAQETELLARAYEMGLEPVKLNDLHKHAGGVDVIINTIPAKVLTAAVIAKMQPHALIVDLASKPGGTDFQFAEKRGIKALLAPGLPGIVAPKTAGRIIANVLATLLTEQWEKRKGGAS